jgi:hypothetical protein
MIVSCEKMVLPPLQISCGPTKRAVGYTYYVMKSQYKNCPTSYSYSKTPVLVLQKARKFTYSIVDFAKKFRSNYTRTPALKEGRGGKNRKGGGERAPPGKCIPPLK